jgi:hypothetical protein
MTGLLVIVIPAVAAVLVFMAAMIRVNRSAPQAYYLKKERDVSLLYGEDDPAPKRDDDYTLP